MFAIFTDDALVFMQFSIVYFERNMEDVCILFWKYLMDFVLFWH